MLLHKTLTPRAVAVGAGVYLALTVLFAILCVVVVRAAGIEVVPTGLSIQAGTLLVGLAFVAVGGSVAARRARVNPVVNAAAVGALVVLVNAGMMGLMTLFPMTIAWLSWSNILANVLTIPAAVLGGWSARARSAQVVAG